ncbi:cytochrome c [Wenzhouxiangella sp. XN79A]|uniref:c-type cytochrome n=1 Tax=Wenzhouxiangella sp. XN79A TaxID=2724193 RepID=UPI00144A8DB8|nr:cytochrome c [Wenzhouxiangella sp. XN79A]NKI35522.1 cytochrome c [Wenzhouxiangella sp. XN79A]
MRRSLIALALLLGAPITAAAEGDEARGRILAYTCSGCHGIPFYNNTYPTYTVPRLGGQNEGYIVSALKAYRAGQRKHPSMQAQANTLSDQDIADIAAYLTALGEDA